MQMRSLADVKAHLSEVVDEVESTHERIVITRHGRPAAAVLGVDDLDTLEETLAWCQEVISRYRAGERDPEGEAGPFVGGSQLDREVARALHRDGAA